MKRTVLMTTTFTSISLISWK